MNLSRRLVLAAVLVLPLAGCATLPGSFEKPRVSVAGLRILEIGLLEQRYLLRLRVQNPNDFAFAVTGMDYALDVNGREFASGVSDRRVDLPAYSERSFQVPVSSGLADLVDQLRALDNGRMNRLDYRIRGHVRIEGIPGRVEFDHSDELLPGQQRAPGEGVIRST